MSSPSPLKRPRRVSREEQVVLDRQPSDFYAFVYNIWTGVDAPPADFDEVPPSEDDGEDIEVDDLLTEPGRWIVEMECLDADWFHKVADELRVEQPSFGDFIAALRGGETTADAVTLDEDPAAARSWYALHQAFTRRMINSVDPAPVSLLQAMIDPDEWARHNLREGAWYRLALAAEQDFAPAASLADVPTALTVHSVLELDANDDPPPKLRNLTLLEGSGPIGELLRALHRPTINPDAGQPPAPPEPEGIPPLEDVPSRKRSREETPPLIDEDISDSDDEPMIVWHDPPEPPMVFRVLLALRRIARTIARWLTPPGPPLVTASAWPVAFPAPAGDEEAMAPRQRYVGAPSSGMVNRMPNPVQPGAPLQPFIGVMNIGQGNCNQICDNNHKVICYYDYGSPLHNYLGTAPNVVAPCLHDDPIMVLSHWDYDHIGMVRRNPYSYQLRWIVPRQDMGSASARDVYTRIIAAGQIMLWPGANGGPPTHHLALPWGFIERGIVRNQLSAGSKNMNDGGLVMYVCVRDGAGGVGPGPAWPAALAPRAAPVEATAHILANIAVAGHPNVTTQQITYAAAAAAEEARRALGVGPPIGGGYIQAASNVARLAILAAGGGAHWGTAWAAIALIGGGNAASLGAARVAVPGGIAGGTTADAAFAAAAGLLGGAGLNAGGGAGITNTIQVLTAAAIVDAALTRIAGGTVAATLAAARAVVRRVMSVHARVAVPAPAPPGYPAMPAWPVAGAIPAPVVAGTGATHANERFVLLTGDVGISHIPSQTAANRPIVVGLTTTHHGAHTCFPHTGSQVTRVQARGRVPWAPRSAAAMAAYLAEQVAQNGAFALGAQNNVRAATIAAATGYALRELHLAGRANGAVTLAQIVTAAISALQNVVANDGVATLNAIAGGGAVAAAAAALGAQIGAVAANTSCAAAAQANVLAVANTLLAGHNIGNTVAAMIIADTAAAVANAAFNAALEHTAAVAARATANDGEHATTNPVMWAPPAIATQTVWPHVAVFGNYANVPSAAVRAAVAPWRAAQTTAGARQAAIILEATHSAAQAHAVFNLPASGKVANSYGITAAGAHLYVSGGYGHPHPNAMVEYAARGWIDRRDTPATAHAGAQPFATAPPGGARGNAIALGWENAGGQDRTLQGGGGFTIQRTACSLCADQTYNC